MPWKPDGYVEYVGLYDANIRNLNTKYIPLFVVARLFFLLPLSLGKILGEANPLMVIWGGAKISIPSGQVSYLAHVTSFFCMVFAFVFTDEPGLNPPIAWFNKAPFTRSKFCKPAYGLECALMRLHGERLDYIHGVCRVNAKCMVSNLIHNQL